MNIENRIKKIENAAGVNSEHCTCQGGIVTRVIGPDVVDRTEKEWQKLIDEAQKPENCHQCRKVIEKQVIVIRPHSSLRTDVRHGGHSKPRETKPGETFATFNIETKSTD